MFEWNLHLFIDLKNHIYELKITYQIVSAVLSDTSAQNTTNTIKDDIINVKIITDEYFV